MASSDGVVVCLLIFVILDCKEYIAILAQGVSGKQQTTLCYLCNLHILLVFSRREKQRKFDENLMKIRSRLYRPFFEYSLRFRPEIDVILAV